MKRALLFALFLAACDAASTASVTAAVGIEVGSGPHKGIIQEQQGTKVELVPMTDGTVRAYITDAAGTPQRATSEVKMTVSAPSFSPTDVTMAPAEGGAYLVGRLPGPPPSSPATVAVAFPAGVTFNYEAVPFAPGIAVAPVVPVVTVTTPPTEGVPPSFAPPHQGTVTRVGDNLVEVVIMPKGEVHAYAYTLDAQPIPVAEVSIPEIEIQYQKKPYKVVMAPASAEPYLVGHIDAKVEIPAQAEIVVACPKPVKIKSVVYEPTAVVFAPYVVAAPIVVVAPAVIVTPPAPPTVVVTPPPPVVVTPPTVGVGVTVKTPAVVVTPPPPVIVVPPKVSVEVGVGIGVGVGVKTSHKSVKTKKCPPGHVWSDGKCHSTGKGNEKKKYSGKGKK